jgi:gluconolactonase
MRNLMSVVAIVSAATLIGSASAQPASAPAATMEVQRLDSAFDAVMAPGAKIEKVASGFNFVEGPMWHKGRLWFSDVGGEAIYAMTPAGQVSIINAHAGGLPDPPKGKTLGPNGQVPDKDGTVLYAQQGGRILARIDDKGTITPVLTQANGKRLNSPNDLVIARDGAVWFTDPPFGPQQQVPPAAIEQPYAAVWRWSKGQVEAAVTDLKFPNGLGFSPNGKTLYVNSYGDNNTRAYDVGAGGKLSNPRVFYAFDASRGRGRPDGLKVDSLGNVWSTGPGGIHVISPQGRLLGLIRLPEVCANLAFAEDGRTVYLTASTSVYRVRAKVKGSLPRYYRR